MKKLSDYFLLNIPADSSLPGKVGRKMFQQEIYNRKYSAGKFRRKMAE
jgi:hypothetical protein